jgi:DivIVA domain-containing protein
MTSELDLPLLPSAEQIRRREFATIRRGYDPDQVRDYLLQVAAQVETLEHDLREIRLHGPSAKPGALQSPGERLAAAEAASAAKTGTAEGEAAQPKPAEDAYEQLAKRFSGLIATADKESTRILEEAKAEASRILGAARSEADRIRVDAQARAEEARQQGNESLARARQESERLLSGLSKRRESLVSHMDDMRTKLLTVARDIEAAIDEPSNERAATERPPVASSATSPATESTKPAASPKPPAPTASTAPSPGEDPVDPRYEDLWVSPPPASRDEPRSGTVDIPDLASIDVDFDEERRGES